MRIPDLPEIGRCTAEAFGHSSGSNIVLPPGSLQTEILNLKAIQEGLNARLSFAGVRSLFGEDNIAQLSGASAKRVFLFVYRCDEFSDDPQTWSLVSPTTGNLDPIRFSAVENLDDPDYGTKTFLDTFGGIEEPDSIYWYVVFTMVSPNDSLLFSTLVSDEDLIGQIEAEFDSANEDIPIFWSPPLVTSVSFLPTQEHVILDLDNLTNFKDIKGVLSSVGSPRLTSTAIGTSIAHTLTATYMGQNFLGLTKDQWNFQLSLNDLVVQTPPLMDVNPFQNTLSFSGTLKEEELYPGDYSVLVSHSVTDSASSLNFTTSQAFKWLVYPLPLTLSSPEDSLIGIVEIGTPSSLTLSSSGGFSTGPMGPVSFIERIWTVTNLSSTGLDLTPLTQSASNAIFQITFEDNQELIGVHTFDLSLEERCLNLAPVYCSEMVSSISQRVKVRAVGHNFDFSIKNRNQESLQKASNYSNLNTFIPIYFDHPDDSMNFSSYQFQAVNMKGADSSALLTAEFKLEKFIRNDVLQSVAGGLASAGGLRLKLPLRGTTDSINLQKIGSVQINDRFIVAITAESSSSIPPSTTLTLGFIVVEAVKPTITASSILDPTSFSSYVWPNSLSISSFPSETNALLSVSFSEEVSGLEFRIDSGGPSGKLFAMNPMAQSSSTFTYILTSGMLVSYTAQEPETSLLFSFSSALDQQNLAYRNVMDDALAEFKFVRTPFLVNVRGEGDLIDRNGPIILEFSEPLTGPLSAIGSGIFAPGLNDFSLSYGKANTSVYLNAVAGLSLPGSGTTLSLKLTRGSIYARAGIPNIHDQIFDLNFEPDLNPPLLLSFSQSNDAYRTNPIYELIFDEPLDGNVKVILKNITNDSQKTLSFIPDDRALSLKLPSLNFDSEYEIILENISDGMNVTTLTLDALITLPDSPAIAEEIKSLEDQLINDTEAPEITAISPNFFLSEFQQNIPLRPVITIDFSEKMALSTTSAFALKKTSDNTPGPNLELIAFDGARLTMIPSQDLLAGVNYLLVFDAKAVDSSPSENLLRARTIAFTTYDFPKEGGDTNTAPRFLGSNMNGVLEASDSLQVFFSEPVDPTSMNSAFQLFNSSGVSIEGLFKLKGSAMEFQPQSSLIDGLYSFVLDPQKVKDFLGKMGEGRATIKGEFSISSALDIRRFQLYTESDESTLKVTATWLAPLNKSGIDSYELIVRPISNFTLLGPEQIIGKLDLISGTVLKITTDLANFSPGDSFQFSLRAISISNVLTQVDESLFSLPSREQTIATTFLSSALPNQVCLGKVSLLPSDVARVCLPPGALRRSSLLSLAKVSDSLFANLRGGGRRYSGVIQLGAGGMEFLKPADLSIRFEDVLGLKEIHSGCEVLDSSCAQELARIMIPMVYDPLKKVWDGSQMVRSHVEILDDKTAILHAKTFHFSSYQLAQSLVILSPENGANLSEATISEGAYRDFIYLSGDPTEETVDISFSPPGFGFSAILDTVEDRIEISSPEVIRPEGDDAQSVTMTIRVTDFAAGTTEIRQYLIPLKEVSGREDFAGVPRPVDSFPVHQISSDTVHLAWSIAQDRDSSIHEIIVEGTNILTRENLQVSMKRSADSTEIRVAAGAKYFWKIHTKSFRGTRSALSQDLERVTFGSKQTIYEGSGTAKIGDFEFKYQIPSGQVFINFLDEESINLLARQGTLKTPTSLDPQFGLPLEFFPGSGVDFNFSGITESNVIASLSFSINRTGSMQIYHYSQGPESGLWEALPRSNSGNQRLWATLEESQDETEITIFSKGGVGSPFVVGPLSVPNIVKAGGGGGCSVASGAQQFPSWFISFLMTLALLLGWAYLNKNR